MNKGFTLIEVIIVICIFLLLIIIFWPIGANFYRQQLLISAEKQIVTLLNQARSNAIDQKNNAAFGLYLKGNQAILFQGLSYEQRQADQDTIYDLPSSVIISGVSQIVFAPNSGFTDSSDSIKLSAPPFSREIKINALGVVDY